MSRARNLPFSDTFRPADLPFALEILPPDAEVAASEIEGARIVLAAGDNFRNLHVSSLCQRLGVPCVYIIEYTLDTRLKIIALETPGWLQRLESSLWTLRTEMKRRRAFRLASGLQANGLPSAQAYQGLTPNLLGILSIPIGADLFATDDDLSAKFAGLRTGRPLRLVYCGSWSASKAFRTSCPSRRNCTPSGSTSPSTFTARVASLRGLSATFPGTGSRTPCGFAERWTSRERNSSPR